MRASLKRVLLIWIVTAFTLAFAVGISAVYIGLDINKDDELCKTVTAGAEALVTLGGSSCELNLTIILTHFGKYFLLVYVPLMVPTALYGAAGGVGAMLRRARSGDQGKGRSTSHSVQ